MAKTKIEWTEYVWNPVTGCTPIAEGCKNCYAKRMANRLRGRFGYPADDPFRVTLHPDKLNEPLKWKKPRKIFVCSMGDLFHEDVPDEFIKRVFCTMFNAKQHQFVILTKRPDGLIKFWRETCAIGHNKIDNLLLGFSASTQKEFDEGLWHMAPLAAAGWKVIVSLEPLLGPIDISKAKGLALVIVGGESGPGARPCNIEHVRSIVQQCKVAGVPCFVKQLGSNPEDDDDCWKDCPQYPECYSIAAECSAEQKKQSITENIKHPKGGDPSEWSPDLRIRQFPSL